jgi:hypothetical protein
MDKNPVSTSISKGRNFIMTRGGRELQLPSSQYHHSQTHSWIFGGRKAGYGMWIAKRFSFIAAAAEPPLDRGTSFRFEKKNNN